MFSSIDTLPDGCLLSIFDLIPLSDLLHLDRVCPRWANLLPSACARRRTLTLMIRNGIPSGDIWHWNIPFNDTYKIVTSDGGGQPYFELPERDSILLSLPSLMDHPELSGQNPESSSFTELSLLYHAHQSGQLVTHLTELFPNVSTLVVIHPKCLETELRLIVELLGFWSLRILKLWIMTSGIDEQYVDRLDHHPVRTLLDSIYRQSSLTQLVLDIDGDQFLHDFNIFTESNCDSNSNFFIAHARVLKLYFGRYDRDNAIWPILHRFDCPTEVREIGLGNNDNLPPMKMVLNPEFEFPTKVRQLYGRWCFNLESVGKLRELCFRFPALTMLRMVWSPTVITFAQLVTNLATIEQLVHLELYVIDSTEPTFMDHVDQEMSLPRMRNLDLSMSKRAHHLVFDCLSPRLFPSLEVILLQDYLYGNRCTICVEPNSREDMGVYDHDEERDGRCHRLLIRSLKNNFAGSSVRHLYAKYSYDSEFVDYMRIEDDDDLLPEEEEEIGK